MACWAHSAPQLNVLGDSGVSYETAWHCVVGMCVCQCVHISKAERHPAREEPYPAHNQTGSSLHGPDRWFCSERP